MKLFKILFILAILGIVTTVGVIYSGIYPIGADVPHNKLTYWILEQTRERSIERSAFDIVVPELDSPDLLVSGGIEYNEKCSFCHLKPGLKENGLSIGLYPEPPNLSLEDHEANHGDGDESTETQKTFWTIKHGIKASGMPAWGKTLNDDRIWALVAFIQNMPEMTPDQYQVIISKGHAQGSSETDH